MQLHWCIKPVDGNCPKNGKFRNSARYFAYWLVWRQWQFSVTTLATVACHYWTRKAIKICLLLKKNKQSWIFHACYAFDTVLHQQCEWWMHFKNDMYTLKAYIVLIYLICASTLTDSPTLIISPADMGIRDLHVLLQLFFSFLAMHILTVMAACSMIS